MVLSVLQVEDTHPLVNTRQQIYKKEIRTNNRRLLFMINS